MAGFSGARAEYGGGEAVVRVQEEGEMGGGEGGEDGEEGGVVEAGAETGGAEDHAAAVGEGLEVGNSG